MKPVRPDLLIKGSSLDFSHAPQTDAEGQIARRRVYAETPAGPGSAGHVNAVGNLPAIIEYTSTAGELANSVKTACIACKHYDQKAWRQFVALATGPASTAEDRQTIQQLRGRLLIEGRGVFVGEEFDVEATLNSLGICRVLSDWMEGAMKSRHPAHWPVVPEHAATCPTAIEAPGPNGVMRMEITTPAQPLGLFKPKDLDMQKIGDKRRDAVLFDAAGKVR